MEQNYTGPERREYCTAHAELIESIKSSVPRWVFILSVGATTSIIALFMGWVSHDLDMFKVEVSSTLTTRLAVIEKQLEERISISRELYSRDTERFYKSAEKNQDLLIQLQSGQNAINVRLQEFKTNQDIVLKKIKIAE